MAGTSREVELNKIRENTARIVEICAPHGIEVLGVTKGFSAVPEIVSAMLAGGVERIADARLENVELLRSEGFAQHMTLLRIPMISQADRIVRQTQCSLNSEIKTMCAHSDAATAAGVTHEVVLMIDLGDLREGVVPVDAVGTIREAEKLPGIRVAGIGTNMGCYGGILPTATNLSLLCAIARVIEETLDRKLEVISGGGTSSIQLVKDGKMPPGVNQLRIGEGILLGTDTTHQLKLDYLHQDAFLLKAEIVELKDKPSVPIGRIGRDAFGNVPQFEDLGIRRRAILALGRQDVQPEGLIPVDPGIQIMGASSDHMILDVEECTRELHVGDRVAFRLKYQGLMNLVTSPYVPRIFLS